LPFSSGASKRFAQTDFTAVAPCGLTIVQKYWLATAAQRISGWLSS
jgi:hypothetical protein